MILTPLSLTLHIQCYSRNLFTHLAASYMAWFRYFEPFPVMSPHGCSCVEEKCLIKFCPPGHMPFPNTAGKKWNTLFTYIIACQHCYAWSYVTSSQDCFLMHREFYSVWIRVEQLYEKLICGSVLLCISLWEYCLNF